MQQTGSYLQLVSFEGERVSLNFEGAKRTFADERYHGRKITLASVIGPSRSGKSFLVAYLTSNGRIQGNFSIQGNFRSGFARYTEGIQIYDIPMELPDGTLVFFLDTQGTFDLETSQIVSDWIMTFSLLISGLQIINLRINIDGDNLRTVYRAVEAANAMKENATGKKLLFLIRDSARPGMDPESFLKELWEKGSKSEELSAAQRSLKQRYEIECVLAPAPQEHIMRCSGSLVVLESVDGPFTQKLASVKAYLMKHAQEATSMRRIDWGYWEEIAAFLNNSLPVYSSRAEVAQQTQLSTVIDNACASVDLNFTGATLKSLESRMQQYKSIMERNIRNKRLETLEAEAIQQGNELLEKEYQKKLQTLKEAQALADTEANRRKRLQQAHVDIGRLHRFDDAVGFMHGLDKYTDGDSVLEKQINSTLEKRLTLLLKPFLSETVKQQCWSYQGIIISADDEMIEEYASDPTILVEEAMADFRKTFDEVKPSVAVDEVTEIAVMSNTQKELMCAIEAAIRERQQKNKKAKTTAKTITIPTSSPVAADPEPEFNLVKRTPIEIYSSEEAQLKRNQTEEIRAPGEGAPQVAKRARQEDPLISISKPDKLKVGRGTPEIPSDPVQKDNCDEIRSKLSSAVESIIDAPAMIEQPSEKTDEWQLLSIRQPLLFPAAGGDVVKTRDGLLAQRCEKTVMDIQSASQEVLPQYPTEKEQSSYWKTQNPSEVVEKSDAEDWTLLNGATTEKDLDFGNLNEKSEVVKPILSSLPQGCSEIRRVPARVDPPPHTGSGLSQSLKSTDFGIKLIPETSDSMANAGPNHSNAQMVPQVSSDFEFVDWGNHEPGKIKLTDPKTRKTNYEDTEIAALGLNPLCGNGRPHRPQQGYKDTERMATNSDHPQGLHGVTEDLLRQKELESHAALKVQLQKCQDEAKRARVIDDEMQEFCALRKRCIERFHDDRSLLWPLRCEQLRLDLCKAVDAPSVNGFFYPSELEELKWKEACSTYKAATGREDLDQPVKISSLHKRPADSLDSLSAETLKKILDRYSRCSEKVHKALNAMNNADKCRKALQSQIQGFTDDCRKNTLPFLEEYSFLRHFELHCQVPFQKKFRDEDLYLIAKYPKQWPLLFTMECIDGYKNFFFDTLKGYADDQPVFWNDLQAITLEEWLEKAKQLGEVKPYTKHLKQGEESPYTKAMIRYIERGNNQPIDESEWVIDI
ncbi:unnamed protein product, partial [Mesorhabditis spiculigera]